MDEIASLSTAPSRVDGAFAEWILQKDTPKFLYSNAQSYELVLYANADHLLILSAIVPTSALDSVRPADLRDWDLMHDKWSYNYDWDKPDVWHTPPFDSDRNPTFRDGEALIVQRSFAGFEGEKSYYELSQKFSHIFDLHFVSHMQAWCRLDEHGDVEPVVKITNLPKGATGYAGTIITVSRQILDEYLLAGRFALVRAFDFTRYEPKNFNGWGDSRVQQEISDDEFGYQLTVQSGVGSYLRGVQIVRPLEIIEECYSRLRHGRDNEQYASFIAQDAKNSVIAEISCAPGATANYFTQSELPFEVTPAFFRPEVLQKYKADSIKYTVEERSIHCRGTWSLKTYDINDAGQVHTYLVYLRSLPYQEQLYWKSFNEKPRAPISKRAFTTDIMGDWFLEYNGLQSLLHLTRRLDRAAVRWWKLKSADLIDNVHYPVTAATEEWANEILTLDQLLVEGLETKWLRETADKLSQSPQPNEASLKLLERCLVGVGFDEDEAKATSAPLRELHHLRSKVKGHARGSEAETLKSAALKTHGSYKKHFEDMCTRCDTSLERVANALASLGGVVPGG